MVFIFKNHEKTFSELWAACLRQSQIKTLPVSELLFGQLLNFILLFCRSMTGFFYPRHILYIKASELAFEDCFHEKRWRDAIDYGQLCLNSYRKFTLGDQVNPKN